jgi:hypothetical protein
MTSHKGHKGHDGLNLILTSYSLCPLCDKND